MIPKAPGAAGTGWQSWPADGPQDGVAAGSNLWEIRCKDLDGSPPSHGQVTGVAVETSHSVFG